MQLKLVKKVWECELDIKNYKLKRKSFREQEAAWRKIRPSATTWSCPIAPRR